MPLKSLFLIIFSNNTQCWSHFRYYARRGRNHTKFRKYWQSRIFKRGFTVFRKIQKVLRWTSFCKVWENFSVLDEICRDGSSIYHDFSRSIHTGDINIYVSTIPETAKLLFCFKLAICRLVGEVSWQFIKITRNAPIIIWIITHGSVKFVWPC